MNPNYQLPIANYQLGLIGYPLDHSLSPRIHSAALKSCGLAGDYSLFPIPPEDRQALQALLARVRSGDIRGLNVTIPHKQSVVEFMDDLTPTAQAIGAVNAMYMRGNKLIGDNTDAAGFLADLKKVNKETGAQGNKSALVLGAGGSARAVVYALLNDGWNVTLAARRLEQAGQLAKSVASYRLQVTSYETFQPSTLQLLSGQAFDLLVNTTPLGMTPNIDQSPLPENILLPKDIMIYDLVYNPRETKLVRDAKAQGCRAATGIGMLIEQAALAFELWTGHTPPRTALYQAI
ncbi:MAG: shikimate dehydrogenase [Chloroflexi bacterium]|nr:shikimate dehydrogenase [Chloroflexi bacterium CFX1]MCK6568052.1 shikimate dehydrogenase [Anaerolineales bacterium]MCQ3952542.1 shikimate dehydrogenase [Chloroflexota bacterium]MDL1919460.1 shikimate dehydrogenase [Chloroflexi bacterium CFX5]NUQ60819.1 shikimate dehydrogenase [Anaerolineales bacterium]